MTTVRRRITLTDEPHEEAEPTHVAPEPARPRQNRRILSEEQIEELGRRYRVGDETLSDLSAEFGIGESTLRYHRDQRGWVRESEATAAGIEAFDGDTEVLDPITFARLFPDAVGSFEHPRSQQQIVRAVMHGMPKVGAAELIGGTDTGLEEALKRDRAFRKQVIAAQRWWEFQRNDAAARGRPADQRKLLEVHPFTREDYGRTQDVAPVLNIVGLFDRRAGRQQVQQREVAPAIEGSFELLPPAAAALGSQSDGQGEDKD